MMNQRDSRQELMQVIRLMMFLIVAFWPLVWIWRSQIREMASGDRQVTFRGTSGPESRRERSADARPLAS